MPATQAGSAYRPLDPALCLDGILCLKYYRMVALDNTVTLDRRTFRVLLGPGGQRYARRRVEIQERLNGRVVIFLQGMEVGSTAVPDDAVPPRARRNRGIPGQPVSRGNGVGHASSPRRFTRSHAPRRGKQFPRSQPRTTLGDDTNADRIADL